MGMPIDVNSLKCKPLKAKKFLKWKFKKDIYSLIKVMCDSELKNLSRYN